MTNIGLIGEPNYRGKELYNLLVQAGSWPPHQEDFPGNRVLEYTEDRLSTRFKIGGLVDYNSMKRLPALFMPEQGTGDNLAKIGTINRFAFKSSMIRIEYSFDSKFPPLSVDWISSIADNLRIHPYEFSRTHWALKEVDLFRELMTSINSQQNQAEVFKIEDRSFIEDKQISVMMPFTSNFDGTYEAIKAVANSVRMRVNRADDIWENRSIIQDIIDLIAKSRIIIADCTGMNPNVFYEIGIAHAIGREVILITQNIDHIPFDLRHLRVVTYLPNEQGLVELRKQLETRVRWLLGSVS